MITIAEENKDNEKESKDVQAKGSADVTGDLGEHKVDFEAKARITSEKSEQAAAQQGTCIECGTTMYQGRCVNADCPVGQAQASRGAARQTAKAGAPTPSRAFASSGRVD